MSLGAEPDVGLIDRALDKLTAMYCGVQEIESTSLQCGLRTAKFNWYLVRMQFNQSYIAAGKFGC